jgi:restriction system protein
MVPVLEVLSDGQLHARRELFDHVADHLGLTYAERELRVASGGLLLHNRMTWAFSALVRAEAVDRPQRGMYQITDGGRTLLRTHPNGISEKDLQQIPAYQDYVPVERSRAASAAVTPEATALSGTSLDPVEQIELGIQRINADVSAQLLKRLREQDPAFLEQSVLDVLVAMGYGGTDGQARRIGGTGDGGVDGVIDQDKLGLQRIYVQAKRYAADNTVGREAIQAFVGALHGRNVTQGIFITTSRFSPGAVDYAASIGTRVVLIDGARLAELMITSGVGVQQREVYRIVDVDEDYFE